jgi:hypothetical protein
MPTNVFSVTLAVDFTVATGGAVGSSGTLNSGSALPIGSATHWKLSAPISGPIQLSVDATVPQGAVVAFGFQDGASTSLPDGYTTIGGVTTWSWSAGHFDSGGGWSTGTPISGSVVTVTSPVVTLATPTLIDGTGVLLEWTPSNLGGDIVSHYNVFRDGEIIADGLDPTTLAYSDQTNTPNTTFTYQIEMNCGEAGSFFSGTQAITTAPIEAAFNCQCETVSAYATLAELRVRMAIQCGYAAMAANLPAGQSAEFNEYLFSAQKQLYYKFRSQRTERFFNWTMTPGERYYGLADSEGTCTLKLDPLAVTWVGFEDLNRAWYRLIEGIDPVYYTRANINFGWPTRYEIHSCIEIFPAPQAAYTLWIKGDIGLAPFTADADRPTFDDEAILLFAVANWKSAKGRQDAERCMGQATQRIQDLTARKYATARFVPSTYVQNPATPPRFLPLGSQQS